MKRTNKLPCELTYEVTTGDQALATGSLVTTSTALNINAGQLMVAAWDPNSTIKLGNNIPASTTSAAVNAIKVLQGTGKSKFSNTVDFFEAGEKAFIESGVIRRGQILSVATKKCDFGQWGAQAFTNFSAPVNATEYGAWLTIDSTRIDKAYPYNDNSTYVVAPKVADFGVAGITAPTDYVLEHIASSFNSQSKLYNKNKNFVVLGVKIAPTTPTAATPPTIVLTGGVITGVTGGLGGLNYTTAPTVVLTGGSPSTAGQVTAQINNLGAITGYTIVSGGVGYGSAPTASFTGGAGTAIGGITPTTVVPFETRGGVQNTIIFGFDGVAALAALVAKGPIVGTSTIEVIDSLNSGKFARVDALIVLGLPQAPAYAYDDVLQTQTQVNLELSPAFSATIAANKVIAGAKEVVNSGRQWRANYRNRAGVMVHTMQVVPMGDFFLEGVDYVSSAKNYTSYVIDFFEIEESTISGPESGQKKLIILLPCELSSAFTATVTNVAARLVGGNPAYPMVTSNDAGTGTASANTVSQLEATLSFWLKDSYTNAGAFIVTGDAVNGGTYLS